MFVLQFITKEDRELSGLLHGLGQVTHVGGGDAGDGYSPVLGQVAAVVPGAGRHMLGHHPSAGKHSNLVSDVLPVSRGLNLIKTFHFISSCTGCVSSQNMYY